MKKVFPIVILAVMLAGCGSKAPDGMNEQTYNIGKQALEIIEKYNDADITADEADSRIDVLYNKLDALELDGTEADKNLFVKIELQAFQYDLFSGGDTYETADDLKEMLGG